MSLYGFPKHFQTFVQKITSIRKQSFQVWYMGDIKWRRQTALDIKLRQGVQNNMKYFYTE